jgi:hypothetical protein
LADIIDSIGNGNTIKREYVPTTSSSLHDEEDYGGEMDLDEKGENGTR